MVSSSSWRSRIPMLMLHLRLTMPPPMLVRLLILDQQLSILIEPARLIPGLLDSRQNRLRLHEDVVHLFEGSIGSLGVEEVDDREDECIDYGKDDIGLIADAIECNWCNHDNHEVKWPIPRSRERVRRCANLQWD